MPTKNSTELLQKIQDKIDGKTKPLGALGMLEKIAFQIASVQKTLTPVLSKPHIVVFTASHGIAASGVSAYPSEVTPQMVLNFLNGGAAINVFTKQQNMQLLLVDSGVDYDFDENEKLIHAKVNYGTKNLLEAPAMTSTEYDRCMEEGFQIIKRVRNSGCNIIGFGEMGIGNTSSASLIMSKLLAIPIEDCVGKGTGLSQEQVEQKVSVLRRVIEKYPLLKTDVQDILSTFGGFEIAMMCAGMLQAARMGMVVLVDGFIASVAYLCAFQLDESVRENAIFCHQSDEKGHRLLMESIGAQPILNMSLRLGEGTGCALAYPLIQSAVAFMNDMASFDSAGVSKQTVS